MFQSLFRRRRMPRPAARPAAPAPDEPAPQDEGPPPCGWFASSADLRDGLSVTEHASAERLAAALPLEDWIAFHLAAGAARLQSGNVLAPH